MPSLIIDSLYENVIAKLTEKGQIVGISQHLHLSDTNEDRVLYVRELIDRYGQFPQAIKVSKTEKTSTYYRDLGNAQFKKQNDYEAWQYYNLSLLHAPMDSENYSLAYANRSAVFYSLKMYEECLKDIDVVLSLNYPDKLKEKLLKRQEQSKEALVQNQVLETAKEYEALMEIKSPKSPRYVCASTKISVVHSKIMGRHLVAAEDIKIGEMLAIEDPYFKILLKSQYLFYCSYCLSESANLLPCETCCFTLYCSEDCKKNAHKEFHRIECSLMPTLIDMQFTKLELLALRTVIKARNDHKDWNGLFTTIHEAENYKNSEFRGHAKIEGEWVYDSKYYASIHTLATNIEKRSVSDLFQKCVSAAVFLHLLKEHTPFLTESIQEPRQTIVYKCIAGLLLLHIMTSPTNMHSISTNVANEEGDYVVEQGIASAPYAFHSLLNHSCAPNVVRFSKLGSGLMSMMALRPIKKGMQLFDNYGVHHALQSREERQSCLKFQYKFNCVCEACTNNWPLYFHLGRGRNQPEDIYREKEQVLDPETVGRLQKGDLDVAFKKFKSLCEMAEILEPYAPCKDLADCQEALKQCMILFHGGKRPFGFSKIIDWEVVPDLV